MNTDTDVIIVGAGPTGLMLAAELRLGGARVIVIERRSEPAGPSRGLGFTARAMEVLDQRGLLPWFGIPRPVTESDLEHRAVELGAGIRRGWEFLDLVAGQDDPAGAVEISVRAPDGTHRLRAAYLVGCDGGQSAVRTAAGFDFPASPATRLMYLADVIGRDLRPRLLGERLPRGMVMAAPLRPGVDRIIVCEHGAEPVEAAGEPSFAEVADAWQRITGEDIHGADAEWVSAFTDTAHQVTRYRRGRVLLAGAAAHLHPPTGRQGLSTGLLDAVNLGWKLAGVVAGWAPDDLLDTYHGERHPAGARLRMNTRARGTIFLGGEQAQPLRELLAELIEHDAVKRHLAGVVTGLDLRDEVGDHPLLGHRIPPVVLRGAARETGTTEPLHAAQGVLLLDAAGGAARGVADGWKDRVVTATVEPVDPGEPLADADAVLIRPDGYVAWVGSDPAELSAVLHRWFGAPAGGKPPQKGNR